MNLYSVLCTLFSPLIKVVFRMRIAGTEHIPPAGKLILCSNHRSVMDPILLGVSVGKRPIRYMAKEELFVKHGKTAAWFLRALGAFPVKRGRGDTKAIEQAVTVLKQDGLLGIFPQGGIAAQGIPFQPKSGIAVIAYRAQAPVLPAAVVTNGRVRLFSPVTIRFGKPIAYEAFGFTNGSRGEIKNAACIIAERVNQLLEAKK